MAALLHFEEKVHTRRLTRADTILLLFSRLLCHVLAHMASLLTNGIRYGSISIPQNFPSQGKSLHSLFHLHLLRPLQLLSPHQR
ncbi:hypothetical protein AAG906_002236 [Vitis piasezkii]